MTVLLVSGAGVLSLPLPLAATAAATSTGAAAAGKQGVICFAKGAAAATNASTAAAAAIPSTAAAAATTSKVAREAAAAAAASPLLFTVDNFVCCKQGVTCSAKGAAAIKLSTVILLQFAFLALIHMFNDSQVKSQSTGL